MITKDELGNFKITFKGEILIQEDGEPLTMLYGIRLVSAEEWKLMHNETEEPIKEEPKQVKGKWKRKKRKANKPHPDTVKAILDRDNHTCVECGATDHLEVHHMVHRKYGGEHTEDNLITLCWICHAEKHREEPVYNLMISRIRKMTA